MGRYRQEVERGAGLLDEERPGWRERVDLDSLDLGSCSRCVLGQLLGDYAERVEIGLDDEDLAARHGFVLSISADGGYAPLTEEWREYIAETRSAVGVMSAPREIDRARVLNELVHRWDETAGTSGNDEPGAKWVLDQLAEMGHLTFRKPADDPSKDGVGVVRRGPGGQVVAKGARIGFPWANLSAPKGDDTYSNSAVIDWPVIGVVPGTPAAEAERVEIEHTDLFEPETVTGEDIDRWREEDDEGTEERREAVRSGPPFPYQVREWVEQRARVECFSASDPTDVVHEGRAIGWTEAPTVRVQKDDGQIVSWVIGITRRQGVV